jgi:hypothetical protein
MPGTMDQLVADLLRKPMDSFREELLANARAGLYHDFKSTHLTPKLLLIGDLERYGYRDLARRAMRGAYADKPDAADDADMEASLRADPRLAKIWGRLQATRSPAEVIRIMEEEMAGELTPEQRATVIQECRLKDGGPDA